MEPSNPAGESHTGPVPDYRFSHSGISGLYELAKRKSWNASRDLDWSGAVDTRTPPRPGRYNPFAGYPEFEALDDRDKTAVAWQQHGLEISEILYGEQGALILASQLAASLPSTDAKLFLATQAFDEARHVEFFSRYLLAAGCGVQPPSSALRELLEQAAADPAWTTKLLVCQVIIESLAVARFQRIRRESAVPILKQGIDYVLKDEARHVRFGVEYLRRHTGTLKPDDREAMAQFILSRVFRLANSLNLLLRIGQSRGWHMESLRRHLRLQRIRNPRPGREIFRQLMLSMDGVGLLTAASRQLMDEKRLL